MPDSTHSKYRGRRAAVVWIVVITVALIGLVLLAVLWDRAATASVRQLDPQQAQQGDSPAASFAPHYSARWTYADGDAGRVRVQRAIERATADMDLISRDIARNRLRKELIPPPGDAVELDLRGDVVDVQLGSCPVIRAAPLGEWVDWRCAGEDFRVHHKLTDGALVQRSRGGDSEVRRKFMVEGDRLTLSFRLRHDKLPEPVKFGLHYTR